MSTNNHPTRATITPIAELRAQTTGRITVRFIEPEGKRVTMTEGRYRVEARRVWDEAEAKTARFQRMAVMLHEIARDPDLLREYAETIATLDNERVAFLSRAMLRIALEEMIKAGELEVVTV